MELIYSTRASGFEAGKRYRNPDYFDRPERGVDSVVVEGDYPRIVEAYEALNVPVSAKDPQSQAKAQDEEENASDDERDALAAEYEERTGKKAGRMKADTLREKLDELNEE
ncbi:hypothetical protein MHM84_03700 [Halomonas sp. McH1-25]|uniref:hypothetical protein n=1 Tax=unclassified Halomonas TaxID=2609666 RepID=UPI001EF594DA|nr:MULTISPECIES: hypothetical protein [unclassified Halomonas]MCG7598877.1 hypothetical protein [Halomonas sp. McH1-25]MCP1340840.1 hypothetical protein [Halomonas sp. FL8]MCP1361277.1 hypothetical protein [Halomonas sp. BBD45]MCP1363696.1 hypothetical protein [Halomonas sp. BBD48]